MAAALTLAALLLAPIGFWLVRPLGLVLALAGLLLPGLAARAPFWLALAVLAALRVAMDWPLSDNHAYLVPAWCIALALAPPAAGAPARLALSARSLLFVVFALAVVQKLLISPDYLDGTFFRWLLAVDPRFQDLGQLLGRSPEALERTRAWVEIGAGGPTQPDAAFVEPPALRTAAHALTWATLMVEGAVAAAMALPAARFAPLRDASLLLFCAGTYAVAPVAGFGWVLIAMGVAQSPSRRARALYLGAFALLVFYDQVPWLRALAESVAGPGL